MAKAKIVDDFHPDYQYPFQNPRLSAKMRVDNILSLLTPEEKIGIFGGTPLFAGYLYPGYARLGIQGSRMLAECLHGVYDKSQVLFCKSV